MFNNMHKTVTRASCCITSRRAWLILLATTSLLFLPCMRNIDCFSGSRPWKSNEITSLRTRQESDVRSTRDYKNTDTKAKYVANNPRSKVVILTTQCRSGSSFTGELFAATKGTMYLYEPLLPFGMDCATLEDRKLALLSRMLNCNFTDLQTEYKAGFKVSHFPDYGDCVSTGFCFPKASVGLLKGYTAVCNHVFHGKSSPNFDPKSTSCGYPLNETILHQQCEESKLVFTKVTRACSLHQVQKVYDYLTGQGRDVYVLHLVRDPRSSIYSRIKAWNEDATDVTKVICGRLRKNLEIVDTVASGCDEPLDQSFIATGRYLRVRFEDLSIDAVRWAKEIFGLIGSDLPPEVKENISKLQRNMDDVKRLLAEKKQNVAAKHLLQEMNSPFTAVRDSQEVLRKWRRTIPWKMVQHIQTECADVMTSLGYIEFENEKVLRNVSLPFFLPWNSY